MLRIIRLNTPRDGGVALVTKHALAAFRVQILSFCIIVAIKKKNISQQRSRPFTNYWAEHVLSSKIAKRVKKCCCCKGFRYDEALKEPDTTSVYKRVLL